MVKKTVSILLFAIVTLIGSFAQAQVKTIGYMTDFLDGVGSSSVRSLRLNANAIAFIVNEKGKAIEVKCIDNKNQMAMVCKSKRLLSGCYRTR